MNTKAAQGDTRWHIVSDVPTRSLCGARIGWNAQVEAQHVPIDKRCMGSACRRSWPDYRARNDRSLR